MEKNWALVLDQAGRGVRGLSEGTLTQEGKVNRDPWREGPLEKYKESQV